MGRGLHPGPGGSGTMPLSPAAILRNGVLCRKKAAGFAYDHVFITGCFRIFYSLTGPTAPRNLRDSNHDHIPDYIDNIAFKFETARILLTRSFGLRDPLLAGPFSEKGAKYIDVYLQEIPREHGIASDRVYDIRPEILQGTPFLGKSLRIKIHRNLISRTGTPLHELFHLCQFSYAVFNNMWFMEGLARWSQSILGEGTGVEEPLPATPDQVVALLKKYHEAEYFWNRLTALCDPGGTFALPDILRGSGAVINTHRPGARLIRAILERSEEQCRHLLREQPGRNLQALEYWPEIEKKSPNNNPYLLQALVDAVEACGVRSNEVANFLDAGRQIIAGTAAAFQSGEIQEFMTVLKRCQPELCVADAKEFCSSHHFDPHTRTLTVPRLDCATLADRDLAAFHVLEHVNGDLVIRDNPAITGLDGLRNLETVNGRLELANCAIEELCGLTRLRLAKWLTIEGMGKLTAISGFTSLELVRNTLTISGNPLLQSISGFTSLEGCRTGLTIGDNPSLARISGFSPLARIDYGRLVIKDCPVLTSACGLSGLSFVRDGLAIGNCPELADFRFLSSLDTAKGIEVDNTALADGSPLFRLFSHQRHFKGAVKFTRNKALAGLSFMAGLTSVGSSLYLNQNRLVNLRGLEQLERVGASCNLSANRLTDISQLARLAEIDGILGLSYNRLTSLHGLENLRRIRTKEWGKDLLSIKFNDNRGEDGRICLADIGALANVQEVTGQLVLYTDSEGGHRYRVKPAADSLFATGNTNIRVLGRTAKTELPRSHICELPDNDGTTADAKLHAKRHSGQAKRDPESITLPGFPFTGE